MRRAIQFIMRPISTNYFDARFGQISCYVISLLVLVLGILKLCRLGLDEAHLFFGVLLVLCVMILGIIAGTLAGPTQKAV